MGACLSEEVLFVGPLVEMKGKEAVVSAAKNLSQFLQTIEIREKVSRDNQVMLIYDFVFSKPSLQLRAAALIEVKSCEITKIELFYDGRPFVGQKNQIFQR